MEKISLLLVYTKPKVLLSYYTKAYYSLKLTEKDTVECLDPMRQNIAAALDQASFLKTQVTFLPIRCPEV